MTTVCLIGEGSTDLYEELAAYRGARDALSAYTIQEPWVNTIAVETVSLGGAISLLNDLDWYLVRFVSDAIIREPSVSETEWLSRKLGAAIRETERDPTTRGDLLKIYGVDETGALVEPMYAQRIGDSRPTYDLRDVADTLPVRITEDEFG